MARFLLQSLGAVEQRAADGTTPLMLACGLGNGRMGCWQKW